MHYKPWTGTGNGVSDRNSRRFFEGNIKYKPLPCNGVNRTFLTEAKFWEKYLEKLVEVPDPQCILEQVRKNEELREKNRILEESLTVQKRRNEFEIKMREVVVPELEHDIDELSNEITKLKTERAAADASFKSEMAAIQEKMKCLENQMTLEKQRGEELKKQLLLYTPELETPLEEEEETLENEGIEDDVDTIKCSQLDMSIDSESANTTEVIVPASPDQMNSSSESVIILENTVNDREDNTLIIDLSLDSPPSKPA